MQLRLDCALHDENGAFTRCVRATMCWCVQALEDKQQSVEPLMAEIDALDSQMTALEAMLERLDAATSRLNDKIAAANTSE